MKAHLNYLTVINNGIKYKVEENMNTEINSEAKKMINFLKMKVRENKTVQKDLDLVYVLDQSDYKLPLQYSEDKSKTKWEAFAAKKGIKKRKGTVVYDEDLKKYVPRFGPYSKKNLLLKSAVLEGEKSFSDLKKQKIERIRNNLKNKEANKKRK
ncbi:hypothetical protein P3W45_001769 [Vairimorpha bombi]|jgi:hypothetical protein